MAEPFLGEIRMVSFDFAPDGWALCNGAILNVNQNRALYALLGNQFGGNAPNTFALPDLQGRTPVHFCADPPCYQIGLQDGVETVTLTAKQVLSHTHNFRASTENADSLNVGPDKNRILAKAERNIYDGSANNLTPMNSGCVTSSGGSQPHGNMQPSLVINFIIAMTGIYPPRS